MKRKMFLLAMLPLLLLTACGRRADVETVSDTVTPVARQEAEFTILMVLPDDVTEATFAETGDQHVFEQANGDYEVVTEILRSTLPEEALRSVTGRESDELTVLKTERFGMPEYRTSWYAATEEGGRSYRASVICDGRNCYCVSFSAPEEKAAQTSETMEQIFEAMTLYTQES